MNCLQGFTQESSRDQHQVCCEDNKSVRVEIPKQSSTIEFKDGQNQFRFPFIMYSDFESILELMDPVELGFPNPNQPYTNEVNQHTPSGWCVYSKFAYGDVDNPLRTYGGKDCIETFCNYIKGEACRLYHMFPELPMDPLTEKQWEKYKKATKCHICYKPFTQTNLKVRGHCHYTGLYRGPAHSSCNSRYKLPSYIPVVFHNLSGYDAHLFIRELGGHTSDMEVIAKNKEDYISFSIKVPVDSYIDNNGKEKDKLIELRFIDSFKFMSSSLDSLTKNLVRGGKKLYGFEDYSKLQYGLLTRKGVYPYEYINSCDQLEETQFPPVSGHRRLARSFNLCYRYIDDLIVFNNKKFLDYLKEISPSQLIVEKANKSDHLADYLDLTFIIDSGGKLSTRLYDKRDDFDFHIVNFPFLSSNIPSGPSYGVYISQLIRYARCCSHYDDFRYRHKCLVDRLLSQGYKALRLEKSFKKFYGRYQDLIEKYRRSVNAMVSDSFPGQFLFNM